MTSRRILLPCLLALAAGCDRSKPAGAPGASAPSGTQGAAGKWAVELGELNRQLASQPGTDRDADRRAMLQWIRTRKEYEASGESPEGNLWARFTDGRMVVAPFFLPGTRGGRPAAGQAPAAPAQAPAPRYLLPASRQARLMTADFAGTHTALRSPVPHLKEYLAAAGYLPLEEQATVTALKAVRGDGIFYIDTHGTQAKNRQEEWVFCMITSAAAAADEEDLEAGRLTYLASGASLDGRSCYGVTALFVRRYMSFGQNAFAFINACSSDAGEAFRKAFFEKGAAFYAGWSGVVADGNANIAAKFAFDRLLGANRYTLEPEQPGQRPFDFLHIWHDMQKRGFDSDPHYEHGKDPDQRGSVPMVPTLPKPKPPVSNTKLGLHNAGGPADTGRAFGGLCPSLLQVYPDELKEELVLVGSFGGRPDRVTIDGTSVAVKEYVDDAFSFVRCALPAAGAGSAGPVVATVAGKVTNAVPLTEWRVRFRYTEEWTEVEPPVTKSADIDLHLRADIHAVRMVPHTTPMQCDAAGRQPAGLLAAGDSRVRLEYAGTGKRKADPETALTLSGSGGLTTIEAVRDMSGYLLFAGSYDSSKKAFLEAKLSCAVEKAGTKSITRSGMTEQYPEPLDFESPRPWNMELDAAHAVRAGSVVWEKPDRRMKLQWGEAPARFAPTPETLSSAGRARQMLASRGADARPTGP